MTKYRIFRYIFLFLIFILMLQNVYGQDSDRKYKIGVIEASYGLEQPLWLLMERGRQAFALSEYGLASRIFREVLERESVYPDADMWLALVFVQEGEYILAEKQFLKALENKSQLYIHEDENTILYGLADIYNKTDQYGKYENTLMQIINQDEESKSILNLQYSILDVLKERGADKMFELYRYKNNKFNRARLELGVFHYRTGRYTEAEINLILPAVSIATTGFDYIYKETAFYEYTNLSDHINRMLEFPGLSEFLVENDFFKIIYYLAASLYADGSYDAAADLWRIVADYDTEGSTWKIRAGRQLDSPFIEPIISPRS